MMKLKAIWFAVLSAAVFFSGMPSRAENPVKASPDKFSLAVECVKRFEGWHGEKKHWPYVGWGHKVLPGERFTNGITKAQGDSILRADLRKLCRMFSYLGRDSLLAAVLSYNVGPYRLKGYGKRPKSRLLKKLESGDRNIYKEYVSFRCYKGKVVRKYSINSLVYWVTYVHNVVYSFYRSMIYCYINSTQRCAGSIVIDIIPTNGADKRKFFPFAPYFPVTNVIKRYFYPYFPAIIGIKGYSFPYFPYLSGIMKIKTALYSLFSRLDWHKTVVFPCLGEIYEGIRSLSWEIPVT